MYSIVDKLSEALGKPVDIVVMKYVNKWQKRRIAAKYKKRRLLIKFKRYFKYK